MVFLQVNRSGCSALISVFIITFSITQLSIFVNTFAKILQRLARLGGKYGKTAENRGFRPITAKKGHQMVFCEKSAAHRKMHRTLFYYLNESELWQNKNPRP